MSAPAKGTYVSMYINPSKFLEHWGSNNKEPKALQYLDTINGFVGFGFALVILSSFGIGLGNGVSYIIDKGTGKLFGLEVNTSPSVKGLIGAGVYLGIGTGVFLSVSLINQVAHRIFAP